MGQRRLVNNSRSEAWTFYSRRRGPASAAAPNETEIKALSAEFAWGDGITLSSSRCMAYGNNPDSFGKMRFV
jgi:hypothetical protein